MIYWTANVSTTGIKASATFATVFEYPALNTLGISHVRLDFGPGGVIPPHTHPLASETLYVLEGTIYTGFVSYEGVRGRHVRLPKKQNPFPNQRRYYTCRFLERSDFAGSCVIICSKPVTGEQHPRCSAGDVPGNKFQSAQISPSLSSFRVTWYLVLQ